MDSEEFFTFQGLVAYESQKILLVYQYLFDGVNVESNSTELIFLLKKLVLKINSNFYMDLKGFKKIELIKKTSLENNLTEVIDLLANDSYLSGASKEDKDYIVFFSYTLLMNCFSSIF